jgi:hypothetical protein
MRIVVFSGFQWSHTERGFRKMCGTGEVGEVNELRCEQDLLEIYCNVTAQLNGHRI